MCIRDRPRPSEEEVKKIIEQFVTAYNELSTRNIVHTNLKPANILFHDRVLKLDALSFTEQLGSEDFRASYQTFGDHNLYRSPQQLLGDFFTSKTDVWAIGIIIFQLVAGKTIYGAREFASLIVDLSALRIKEQIEQLECSPELKSLIENCLAEKEQDRFGWSEFLEHPYFQSDSKDSKLVKQRSLSFNLLPYTPEVVKPNPKEVRLISAAMTPMGNSQASWKSGFPETNNRLTVVPKVNPIPPARYSEPKSPMITQNLASQTPRSVSNTASSFAQMVGVSKHTIPVYYLSLIHI
eukprot:TRINITY_DN3677_c0_g1_i8.p1 TRINITY_DN3677_c0_g1~~TRINITY_DN3677_c0_g1_i8.p1  ORF type:complete len:295 (+),score=60.31 TRINITY_DN3677_c0_g1_i8:65-949(+)